MFLRDEGSGACVLLVHGLGASSRVFDHLFFNRPSGIRLLAIDLPRTGQSAGWAPSHPDPIAERLAASLDERGVASAHVFGHSFGALVALALAGRRPGLIGSLTLASAPALGVPLELRLWLESPLAGIAGAFWGRTPMSGVMLPAYLGFIWGRPETLSDDQVAIYREAQRAEGFGEGVVEALRAVASFRLEAEAIRAGGYPKQVLWGERDPLVPATVGERIAQAIGAELTVIDGAGHCLPDERPDVVAAWLARSIGGALRA